MVVENKFPPIYRSACCFRIFSIAKMSVFVFLLTLQQKYVRDKTKKNGYPLLFESRAPTTTPSADEEQKLKRIDYAFPPKCSWL